MYHEEHQYFHKIIHRKIQVKDFSIKNYSWGLCCKQKKLFCWNYKIMNKISTFAILPILNYWHWEYLNSIYVFYASLSWLRLVSIILGSYRRMKAKSWYAIFHIRNITKSIYNLYNLLLLSILYNQIKFKFS